jgi:phosphoenolpyruvate carboxykinase (ATP)
MPIQTASSHGLENHGIHNTDTIYWTLHSPMLYEHVVLRREGRVAHLGPLVVRTGQHTGRSPKDKFVVVEPTSEEHVAWGKINQPMSEAHFDNLHRRLMAYLQSRELYVQDCFAGADRAFRMPIRVITETAWHSLFARDMFIQATPK